MDAKQQACAPSSLILACYFSPFIKALVVLNMSVYFKKSSIPELRNFDIETQQTLLKNIKIRWYEVVSFYLLIGLSCWAGKLLGIYIYSITQNQILSIAIGSSVVVISYFLYEFLLLNFVTRKRLAANQEN